MLTISTMKLSIAAVFILLAPTKAQGPTVANYSFVANFANSYLRADLDVKFFSKYVDLGTAAGFNTAKKLYLEGANFGSFAVVSVPSPGITTALNSRAPVIGRNSNNGAVNLTSAASYFLGSTNLTLNYVSPANCVVGALLPADQITVGCLAPTGTLDANSTLIPYSVTGTFGSRTMIVFAGTNTSHLGSDGKYYTDFQIFLDYYGPLNYADIFVQAALDGKATNFTNGNVNFADIPLLGRKEAAKRGVAMIYDSHAYRYFQRGQQSCSLSQFEEGIALFTGISEGATGSNGNGFMAYSQGDKLCPTFKTCGEYGNETKGRSKVNKEIVDQFYLFKGKNATANCTTYAATLAPIVTRITQLMKIPIVQGTLLNAEKISTTSGEVSADTRGQGGGFAAAILPYVHKCDPTSAATIHKQIWTGTGKAVFKEIKAALEKNYECMGISCSDVGGIVDSSGKYKTNTKPCGTASTCLAKGKRCKARNECCSKKCRFLFRRCG